jgi:branched-chain amino acid transport system substrate-binding protein
MKRVSLVVVLACVVVLTCSLAMSAADTIKIGVVGPLTGSLAPYGEGVSNGAILAVEQANAKGGVLGQQIELIVLDTQADAQQTNVLVNRLIQRDKIVGLVGPVISAEAAVAGPLCQRSKIPMITPTATADEMTQVGDYVFRVCFIDTYQGMAAVNYCWEEGIRKAAVLYKVGDAYSEGLREVFSGAFTKLGGQVITLGYNLGDTDFSAQISNMKSFGAEVVYCPFYYEDAVLVIRQAKAMDYNPTFIGTDGWDAQEVLDQAGDAVLGTVITTHYSPTDSRPMVQQYLADYQARFGHFPIVLAALGYDATRLMIDAIERAGSTDPKAIRDALAVTEGFHGVTGDPITLDANRNPLKDVTIIKVVKKDGKLAFEFVASVSPEI